jgi:carboxyl-terminal processing protease
VIAINTRRRILALSLVVALLLSLYPTRASAAPPSTANLDAIESYVQLIQRESMFDPSTPELIGGASQGLHDYLAQHGDQLTSPLQTTVDGFKREFREAATRHPDLSQTAMFYASLHAMLKPLDEPYTRFLSPDEFAHLQARVEGTDECGLGCHVELDDAHQLTVVETFDKTPAMRAGLQPGDRILAIDGHPTEHLTLTAGKDLLAGPEGTEVALSIRRDGRTLDIHARRTHLEVPNVTWQMLPNGIGYVRLHAFSANVGAELDQALKALDAQGAISYVMDLRDNRGGYVSSAIDVASRFLPPGSRIMSLQQKRRPTINYNSYPTTTHATRIVLLVNERTASASEIVAGCLQDHKVATLMGTRTFGKGLVQKVVPLPDGSAFAISTGKYLTAAGRDLHKRGIPPDITVRQTDFAAASLDPEVRQAAVFLESRRTGVSASTH